MARVLAAVRLRMSGSTVGQMEERGIVYRRNYGVALSHLKELAQKLECSYELAERLWYLEIRETMLLAAMKVPVESMTFDKAMGWSLLVNNIDLAERSAMFLWGKLDFAPELIKAWRESSNSWLQVLANYTYGWYVSNHGVIGQSELDTFVVDQATLYNNYAFVRSIGFVLVKLVRSAGKSSHVLDAWINSTLQSDDLFHRQMAQQVLVEIEFVDETKGKTL